MECELPEPLFDDKLSITEEKKMSDWEKEFDFEYNVLFAVFMSKPCDIEANNETIRGSIKELIHRLLAQERSQFIKTLEGLKTPIGIHDQSLSTGMRMTERRYLNEKIDRAIKDLK